MNYDFLKSKSQKIQFNKKCNKNAEFNKERRNQNWKITHIFRKMNHAFQLL